jgi:hypothetical protein
LRGFRGFEVLNPSFFDHFDIKITQNPPKSFIIRPFFISKSLKTLKNRPKSIIFLPFLYQNHPKSSKTPHFFTIFISKSPKNPQNRSFFDHSYIKIVQKRQKSTQTPPNRSLSAPQARLTAALASLEPLNSESHNLLIAFVLEAPRRRLPFARGWLGREYAGGVLGGGFAR